MTSTTSISFNGINEYINFGDVSTFQKERTDTFSISCWAKSISTSVGTLVAKMSNSGNKPGYMMFLNASGQFEAVLRNSEATNSLRVRTSDSVYYNDGGWHHFVITYDGAGNLLLYVDGVSRSLTTVYDNLSASILNSKEFQIGAYDGINSPFSGNIDEVSFFSEELIASQVLDIFNSGRPGNLSAYDNIESWWQLGENIKFPKVIDKLSRIIDDVTIIDESDNDNDGTMTNGSVENSFPKSAFSQYCLNFDDLEYADFGNILSFERTNTFSFSFWFKTDEFVSPGHFVFSKLDPATFYGYFFVISVSGGIILQLRGSDFIRVQTDPIITLNQWQHIVVTYDGSSNASGISIYVNGESKDIIIINPSITTSMINTDSFLLSKPLFSYEYLKGKISDFAAYNIELSSSNVTDIYNSGNPNDLRLLDSNSSLVAYWRLGDGGEVTKETWPHKIQSWVWGTAKETSTITDASPYDSDGTLYGMSASDITTDTPGGISDYSCSFNGVNQNMHCNVASANYTIYQFGSTGTFSISGWVKTTASSGWLWGNGTNSSSFWNGYGVYLSSGKPTFTIVFLSGAGPSFEIQCDNTINDGYWHHLAVTNFKIANNNYRTFIYIDSVLQSHSVLSNGIGSQVVDGIGFSIGARGAGQYDPLLGQCDEVSIWNKELSQQNINSLYNSESPPDIRDLSFSMFLRGWWRMGSPYIYPGSYVGTEINDKIGDAPGGISYSIKSIDFNGIDGYVDIGDVAELDFDYNDSFSISSWIFLNGDNAWRTVISKRTSGSTGWVFDVNNSTTDAFAQARVIFDGDSGGNFEVYIGNETQGLPPTSWLNIIITYDGSNDANNIKFYVNGELFPTFVKTNTPFSGTMNNNEPVYISRGTDYFQGNIDSISIWNKELDQTDVTEIWNSGDPSVLINHTSIANLIGWWRMGDTSNNGILNNITEEDNVIQNAPKSITEGGVRINYFQMRGIDTACGSLTYHYWTVTGSPDFDGTYAGTLPCGGPLSDISIAASWNVFN